MALPSLDEQVEELRRVLDNPMSVTTVSSTAFPLRVWERMFALGREQSAAVASAQAAAAQRAGVASTTTAAAPKPSGNSPPHGPSLSTAAGTASSSAAAASCPALLVSRDAASVVLSEPGRVANPVLRACRSGALTPAAVRSMTRGVLFATRSHDGGHESSSGDTSRQEPLVVEPSAGYSLIDSANASERNAFAPFIDRSATIDDVINATSRSTREHPVAVLSCVSVPTRSPMSRAAAQTSLATRRVEEGAPRHHGDAVGGNSSSGSSGPVVRRSTAASQHPNHHHHRHGAGGGDDENAASASTATVGDTTLAGRHAVSAFRSQPVRQFAPTMAMWSTADGVGCAAVAPGSGGSSGGGSSGAAPRRLALDRHDLPFDVTPANDFRQLHHPLTGLGHAVPYEALVEEQRTMIGDGTRADAGRCVRW